MTLNDLKMLENKLRLYVFQMKANNSGNLKFVMEYIFFVVYGPNKLKV